MNKIAAAAFLVVIAATAHAYTGGTLTCRLPQVQSDIETQIERIQRAREIAAERVSLATIRVEEQLEIAQEDLERHIEVIERFREQLEGRVGTSVQPDCPSAGRSFEASVESAIGEISAQIAKTNRLIERVRQLRNALEGRDSRGCPPCPTRRTGSGEDGSAGKDTSVGLGYTFGLGYDRTRPPASLDDLERRIKELSEEQSPPATPAESPPTTSAGCGATGSTCPKVKTGCQGDAGAPQQLNPSPHLPAADVTVSVSTSSLTD